MNCASVLQGSHSVSAPGEEVVGGSAPGLRTYYCGFGFLYKWSDAAFAVYVFD
jgi:hypothetical protein